MVEELNSGLLRTNPDSGRVEDLNQGPPDFNSSALNPSATPPPTLETTSRSSAVHRTPELSREGRVGRNSGMTGRCLHLSLRHTPSSALVLLILLSIKRAGVLVHFWDIFPRKCPTKFPTTAPTRPPTTGVGITI